jgi:hypothetical protein
MTLRIRLMLRWAFVALPFQMRQCRRSTSATITAFAVTRSGSSVDKFAAASLEWPDANERREQTLEQSAGRRTKHDAIDPRSAPVTTTTSLFDINTSGVNPAIASCSSAMLVVLLDF